MKATTDSTLENTLGTPDSSGLAAYSLSVASGFSQHQQQLQKKVSPMTVSGKVFVPKNKDRTLSLPNIMQQSFGQQNYPHHASARDTGLPSGHRSPHHGISGSGSGLPLRNPPSRQWKRQFELPTISSQQRNTPGVDCLAFWRPSSQLIMSVGSPWFLASAHHRAPASVKTAPFAGFWLIMPLKNPQAAM